MGEVLEELAAIPMQSVPCVQSWCPQVGTGEPVLKAFAERSEWGQAGKECPGGGREKI